MMFYISKGAWLAVFYLKWKLNAFQKKLQILSSVILCANKIFKFSPDSMLLLFALPVGLHTAFSSGNVAFKCKKF